MKGFDEFEFNFLKVGGFTLLCAFAALAFVRGCGSKPQIDAGGPSEPTGRLYITSFHGHEYITSTQGGIVHAASCTNHSAVVPPPFPPTFETFEITR